VRNKSDFVIARSEATKQSGFSEARTRLLRSLRSLAMTSFLFFRTLIRVGTRVEGMADE